MSYSKYLKYKNKYFKLKKQLGGEITKLDAKFLDVSYFYSYVSIFRDEVIKKIIIDEEPCLGDEKDIFYISGGSNAFTIKFKCKNEINYVVKFLYDLSNFECDNDANDAYVIDNFEREYKLVNLFDCNYIIKIYGRFLYNKISREENDIIGNIIINNSNDTTFSSVITSKPDYKDEMGNETCPYPSSFCGFVLEYAEYSFNDIMKHDPSNQMLTTLFLHYLIGLQHFYNRGYIHGDIKPPNLRYNYDGHIVEGKIIDIDLTDFANYEFNTPKSLHFMSKILYDRLIIINARLRELKKIKLNVKLLKEKMDLDEENKYLCSKYDVYSLAYSFRNATKYDEYSESSTSKIDEKIEMKQFIDECLNLKHTISSALMKILTLSESQ